MTRIHLDEVSARLTQLPALPSVVAELLASFNDEESDIGKLVLSIARDQALTAQLLRVANSSFYGLQSRISTINEALVVLGFRSVRSLLLAVGINRAFRTAQCAGFDPLGYMRHGIGVGLAARELARESGRNVEMAFTAGVLHDIGELVLASCFGEQYAAALAYRNRHDCPLIVAERDVLGVDHAQVGGLLADTWHFPGTLRSAVVDHHAPAAATADSLADVIHVAEAVSVALGQAKNDRDMVLPVDPTAWRRLGLDRAKIAAILPTVLDGMDEACAAFNV